MHHLLSVASIIILFKLFFKIICHNMFRILPNIYVFVCCNPMGNFQYLILAPWVVRSTHLFLSKDDPQERDLTSLLFFPFLLWRMLHNQIWISLSRYQKAKGNNRIVDKSLDFDQVNRERNSILLLCNSLPNKLINVV